MGFPGRLHRYIKTTEVPVDDASSAADRVLSASYIKGQLSAVDSQLAQIAIPIAAIGNPTTGVMTNLVTNGDFQATTGWTAVHSTGSVASNTYTNTGTGASALPLVQKSLGVNTVIGRKYYVRARVRVTNADCANLKVGIYHAFLWKTTDQAAPVQNEWYELVYVLTATRADEIVVSAQHQYADAATATGKVMEVQYMSCIDLTDAFGAANEPLATPMNTLMGIFTNKHFNGNAPISPVLKNLILGLANQTSGKKIRIVAGAIRNTGAGFALISDSEHEPLGIASVTNDTTKITINYDFTATRVLSLVVTPDEIMADNGIFVGASVGTSLSNIYACKNYYVNGYITKSGGANPAYAVDASLSRGVTAAAQFIDAYTMAITHENCDLPNYVNGRCWAKSGNQNCYISSYGLTSTRVKFKNDFTGADVVPADGVYVFEKQGFSKMNPNSLTYTGANFWIYGIFEVA